MRKIGIIERIRAAFGGRTQSRGKPGSGPVGPAPARSDLTARMSASMERFEADMLPVFQMADAANAESLARSRSGAAPADSGQEGGHERRSPSKPARPLPEDRGTSLNDEATGSGWSSDRMWSDNGPSHGHGSGSSYDSSSSYDSGSSSSFD